MDTGSQQSEGRYFAGTLITVAATYLGALAIIAYPLGFLTLWVQLWREYTHDAATALYAASLNPVGVVVVKAFAALGTALFVIANVSTSVGSGVAYHRYFGIYGERMREQLSGSRFFRWFASGRRGRVVPLVAYCFLGALVPWYFDLASIDSGLDFFYYTCSVLIAGGGAAIGTYVLLEHPDEQLNRRAAYAKALPIMICSVVVAVFLLIPLQPPKFPVVRFTKGTVEQPA